MVLSASLWRKSKINTKSLVKKANARMELLRKVAEFGTPQEDLKTIFILFVRSLLEQSATVWHSSLSQENIDDLERVQKSACKVILQEKYRGYKNALNTLDIETLAERRTSLCLSFARSAQSIKKFLICSQKITKCIKWRPEIQKFTKYSMLIQKGSRNPQ